MELRAGNFELSIAMFGLALLFAVLAATSASYGDTRGREYVYRYSGQVLSGFPDKEQQQYSAKAFDTIVRVQPKGEYAVFKIDDAKYAYGLVTGDAEDIAQHEYNYRDVPREAGYVEEPFKVYFKNGKVTRFQVRKDEPTYSVNLKRGLISLFNLDLGDKQTPRYSERRDEAHSSDYTDDYRRSSYRRTENRNDFHGSYQGETYGTRPPHRSESQEGAYERGYDSEYAQRYGHNSQNRRVGQGYGDNYDNRYDSVSGEQGYNHRYSPRYQYGQEYQRRRYDQTYGNDYDQKYGREYQKDYFGNKQNQETHSKYSEDYRRQQQYGQEHQDEQTGAYRRRYQQQYDQEHEDGHTGEHRGHHPQQYGQDSRERYPGEYQYSRRTQDRTGDYRRGQHHGQERREGYSEDSNRRDYRDHEGYTQSYGQRYQRRSENQEEESGQRHEDDYSHKNYHGQNQQGEEEYGQRYGEEYRNRHSENQGGRFTPNYRSQHYGRRPYERSEDRAYTQGHDYRYQRRPGYGEHYRRGRYGYPERRERTYRPRYDADYYKTYEESLLGECETQYVIEYQPYYGAPDAEVLNVTKSRNLRRCLSIPSYYYSVVYGDKCVQEEQEEQKTGYQEADQSNTHHGTAYYYYSIRGNRYDYVIEKVTSENEVSFTPYPLRGQTAAVFTNRTLILVEEKYAEQDYEPTSELATYTSLQFDIPYKQEFRGPVDLREPHYLHDILERKADKEGIRRIFEHLLQVYGDQTYQQKVKDRNYPAIFLELVRQFSTLGYSDIRELYDYIGYERGEDTEENNRIRRLFHDVLVNAGTNPSILFQKDLIRNRKVFYDDVVYFLSSLRHHVKEVTEALLDEIHDLCQDDYVKSDYNAYEQCYYALANIVYDRCVAHNVPYQGFYDSRAYSCPEDVPQKYLRHIARAYEQTDDEHQRTAFIKAIGYLGVREVIPYLQPHIEGHGRESLYLRTAAIYAITPVGIKYPEIVYDILLPVYYNQSEHYEIRIAAFSTILTLVPEVYELETIAKSLLQEEDDQVRSYVYSTLVHLANSTHPCDNKRAEAAIYALASVERYREEFEKYDYSYSKRYYYAGYDEDYGFGGHTLLDHIASDTGYIPRMLYLELANYIGGRHIDVYGIGFRQYGLERYVDRVFGPEAEYNKNSILGVLRKSTQREQGTVGKERQEYKEKLDLPLYTYPRVHGEIFIKVKGRELPFVYFDESTFRTLFAGYLSAAVGGSGFPETFGVPVRDYQLFFLEQDLTYVLPSEAGLPVLVEHKKPVHVYTKNNELQFGFGPSDVAEEQQEQVGGEIRVRVNSHYVYDQHAFESVGVVVPFDEVIFGAGINQRITVSLPVQLEAAVDVADGKLKTKFTPVVPHEIFHFHYEPYTYTDSYRDYIPVNVEETYRPVRRVGFEKQVEKDYFHEEFGIGFHVETNFDNEFNDYGSYIDFFATNSLRQQYYYLLANPHFEPYYVDVVFEPAEQAATREIEVQIQYDQYRGDYSKDQSQQTAEDERFQGFDYSTTGKDFFTSILQGEIVASGEKERRIQYQITHSRHISDFFQKLDVYFERTPFTHHETEGFKLCYSSYFQYPKNEVGKVLSFDVVDVQQVVRGEAKIHFGRDCQGDKKIHIQTLIEPSEEQIELQQRREEQYISKHQNPYAYYYQKCVQERENREYPQSCFDYLSKFFELNKYTYHIRHENLSPYVLNITYQLEDFFKSVLYPYAQHNYIDVENAENELHIEANFSTDYPIGDIRVTKPQSESHYDHVYIPFYAPFVSYPEYRDYRIKHTTNNHFCLLHGDSISTFDNYAYETPRVNCYVVFAKDCSPYEHFIVLTRRIEHTKYERALKVILGDHKVEVLPVTEDSELIVRVDGEKVEVTDDEPYYYYEEEDEKQLLFTVHRTADVYTVESSYYGVSVATDGHAVYHVNSIFYQSKLCGLCGNYNGQKYDDVDEQPGYGGPQEYTSAYKYIVPSETCSVPRNDVLYRKEGEADEEEEEEECTELKTHIVPLPTRRIPLTCFSLRPVPKCKPGCTARQYITKTIGLHCLRADDQTAKNLERLQEERVLHEIQRKKKDYEVQVNIPEDCYRS